MPFYQQNDEKLNIDCGKGRSITLILKNDTLDIAALRLMWHSQKQVLRDQGRIAQFEKDLEKEGLSDAEYESITQRIQALENKPDNLSVLVDQVYKCVKGWTDYFPSREAEQRGELVPFSKESVEAMGAGALVKITRALGEHLGMNDMGQEDEPGEAKGTSPARLQLAEQVPGSIQTSTSNSARIES